METNYIDEFSRITKYIPLLEKTEHFGEWVVDRENDGSEAHPMHMPFFHHGDLMRNIIDEVYALDCEKLHIASQYSAILEANGIEWNQKSMREADASQLDARCIFALIIGAIRADRFCEGVLNCFFADGSILRWLERLKELDDEYSDMSFSEENCDDDDDDDVDDEFLPRESETFMQLYSSINDAFTMYAKLHTDDRIISFIQCIKKELELFSAGKEMTQCYAFGFDLRVDEECRYVQFSFEPELIEVSDGGSVFDSYVGHDSYTNWMYSIWRNGNEDSDNYECDFSIIEELVLQGADLSIESPEEYALDEDE